MTDPFERLVALRPDVPDEQGWATSPEGRAALSRVHAAAKRPSWWRRRRFVLPTIVIGLGAAVGAGVAFSSADREPLADMPVTCVWTEPGRAQSASGISASTHADHALIVAQCNDTRTAVNLPLPRDWALCVYPPSRGQIGGAGAAIPSTEPVTDANRAAICQAAKFEPAG